jgi:hypothetical protein
VSDIAELVEASETGLVWIGEPAQTFGPYFSRRESAMLEKLLLFPLKSGSDTHALLLITESVFFDTYSDHLTLILAAIAEPAAETIKTQRMTYERMMRQAIAFKPAEIAVVAQRILSRVESFRALRVDLADVVTQIATANPFLDPFRIWQDVLRVLAALFASSASVCDANDHRALLLLHVSHENDTELIVRHAAATLAHYLPELVSPPVLRFGERAMP